MSRSTRDDKPEKPVRLKRQNAMGNLLAGVFKESKNNYDYANIEAYTRSNISDAYSIATIGEHIQFHKRKEKPVANAGEHDRNIQNRKTMFQSGDFTAGSIGWKLHISVNP